MTEEQDKDRHTERSTGSDLAPADDPTHRAPCRLKARAAARADYAQGALGHACAARRSEARDLPLRRLERRTGAREGLDLSVRRTLCQPAGVSREPRSQGALRGSPFLRRHRQCLRPRGRLSNLSTHRPGQPRDRGWPADRPGDVGRLAGAGNPAGTTARFKPSRADRTQAERVVHRDQPERRHHHRVERQSAPEGQRQREHRRRATSHSVNAQAHLPQACPSASSTATTPESPQGKPRPAT